jgi:hypothetical protein
MKCVVNLWKHEEGERVRKENRRAVATIKLWGRSDRHFICGER